MPSSDLFANSAFVSAKTVDSIEADFHPTDLHLGVEWADAGVGNPARPPRLSVAKILRWADAYYSRQGTRPYRDSGPIPDASGETWMAVHKALQSGRRERLMPGEKGSDDDGGDPQSLHEARRKKLAAARHRRREKNLELRQPTLPIEG